MTVLQAATDKAREWPLLITRDLGERAAPDGNVKTGWQIHVRCGFHTCGQSVFCAGNDSGPFLWNLERELEPAVIAHLFQCHRAQMSLDETAAA